MVTLFFFFCFNHSRRSCDRHWVYIVKHHSCLQGTHHLKRYLLPGEAHPAATPLPWAPLVLWRPGFGKGEATRHRAELRLGSLHQPPVGHQV